MNSNFRNFAIWVAIAVLLMVLFNLFQNQGQAQRANEIAYSEFRNQVDAGNVKDVTISGNRIAGHLNEGGVFQTYDAAAQAWRDQGGAIELSGRSGNCAWNQAAGVCR